MSGLMQGLEFTQFYIDNLLCISTTTLDNRLDNLRLVLIHLKDASLKW